jgi:hypothetical protein
LVGEVTDDRNPKCSSDSRFEQTVKGRSRVAQGVLSILSVSVRRMAQEVSVLPNAFANEIANCGVARVLLTE